MTAYCYKNVSFREMVYLTERCSAAAGGWSGDDLGHIFFVSEVHINEIQI